MEINYTESIKFLVDKLLTKNLTLKTHILSNWGREGLLTFIEYIKYRDSSLYGCVCESIFLAEKEAYDSHRECSYCAEDIINTIDHKIIVNELFKSPNIVDSLRTYVALNPIAVLKNGRYLERIIVASLEKVLCFDDYEGVVSFNIDKSSYDYAPMEKRVYGSTTNGRKLQATFVRRVIEVLSAQGDGKGCLVFKINIDGSHVRFTYNNIIHNCLLITGGDTPRILGLLDAITKESTPTHLSCILKWACEDKIPEVLFWSYLCSARKCAIGQEHDVSASLSIPQEEIIEIPYYKELSNTFCKELAIYVYMVFPSVYIKSGVDKYKDRLGKYDFYDDLTIIGCLSKDISALL